MNDLDVKSIELAIAKLDKQFGKNTVSLGDVLPDDVEVISTGNFKLDLKLGVGGLPRGRIIEIFGGEALGKTLLSLGTVANAQKQGGRVLYIDAECDLDPTWAEYLGVDMSKLYLCQPEYGEAGLQVAIDMAATGAFQLIVIDSVAALTPKAELEADMEANHVGLQARMMSQALRKIREIAFRTNTCVIFINQIRDKIGFMANGGTTSPGGRALKFYASVRLELGRMGDIKDNKTNESKGTRVKVKILKNKVGNPMKVLEYDVLHGVGFNNFGSILEMAEQFGLLIRNKSFYYKVDLETGERNEKSFAQGEDSAIRYLEENSEYAEILEKVIREKSVVKRVSKLIEVEENNE